MDFSAAGDLSIFNPENKEGINHTTTALRIGKKEGKEQTSYYLQVHWEWPVALSLLSGLEVLKAAKIGD